MAPTLDVTPLRDASNEDIINAIRNEASSDYQRRIPAATKATLQENMANIMEHRQLRNEFVDALVNRVGLVVARNNNWTNKFAKFKIGKLEYGDTIEEVQVGLAEAYTYDHDRDYLEKILFGQERPEVQSSFHKINRENFYKITIRDFALRRAFVSEGGLTSFIAQLMESPTTSDNWDEYLATVNLFAEYNRFGGFFDVNVEDISSPASDAADARSFLRKVREFAGNLEFISRHYNAAGMPVSTTPDKLELFITPEANAAIDVEALAAAFNIDKATVPSRTNIIPKEHFGIPGAQAVLTTRDFFVIADSRYETTSQYNPAGLHDNYFLHHHQVISASRFVPAILFTTGPGDTINLAATPVVSVDGIEVYDADGDIVTDVTRGALHQVVAVAETNPAGGLNDAVRLELIGATAELTKLTQTGILYVSPGEGAAEVTIRAYATDTEVPQILAEDTFNVVGDIVELWPNPSVGGIVVPAAPTFNAGTDTVTIVATAGVVYRRESTNAVVSGSFVITAEETILAYPAPGRAIEDGVDVSWTFTP